MEDKNKRSLVEVTVCGVSIIAIALQAIIQSTVAFFTYTFWQKLSKKFRKEDETTD